MADDSGDDSIYRSSNCQWKKKPKVLIIGAGIAGISAGSHLAKNGFTDFQILEATGRIGGRIWSIDLGELLSIDQLKHGSNNTVQPGTHILTFCNCIFSRNDNAWLNRCRVFSHRSS